MLVKIQNMLIQDHILLGKMTVKSVHIKTLLKGTVPVTAFVPFFLRVHPTQSWGNLRIKDWTA